MNTTENPVVLVDMDGVLANFEKACLLAWQSKYPDLPFIPLEERVTHDIKVQYNTLGEGLGAKMREIIHSEGFYASMEPIEGAVEVMKLMLQCKWNVFICTAQARNTRCIAEKAEWINQHLGPEWSERLIATRDKTLVRGDVLIDDKPHIIGLYEPQFVHILYDQPYNRSETRQRMTWANWVEILVPLLCTES